MSSASGDPPATAPRRFCPICRRPAETRFRPFCSKRCADIDLSRWLGESYRIPAEDDENADRPVDDEGDPHPPPAR